jgi:predicted small lipoprotein YifL
MKKVFSVLAILLMITSLSACMDNPDGGNKKPTNYGSGAGQQKG